MIDCTEGLAIDTKATIDGQPKEFKWLQVSVPAFPYGLRRLEDDRFRLFALFAVLISYSVVLGLDRTWNGGHAYWVNSLMPFTASAFLIYVATAIIVQIQIMCRYPSLGDRVKSMEPISILGAVSMFFYHFLFPFGIINLVQTAINIDQGGVRINHVGYYYADAAFIPIAAFFFLLFFREPVQYWMRLILYVLPAFVLYAVYDLFYPLTIPHAWLFLLGSLLCVSYGFAVAVTTITRKYKNREDAVMYVDTQSQI